MATVKVISYDDYKGISPLKTPKQQAEEETKKEYQSATNIYNQVLNEKKNIVKDEVKKMGTEAPKLQLGFSTPKTSFVRNENGTTSIISPFQQNQEKISQNRIKQQNLTNALNNNERYQALTALEQPLNNQRLLAKYNYDVAKENNRELTLLDKTLGVPFRAAQDFLNIGSWETNSRYVDENGNKMLLPQDYQIRQENVRNSYDDSFLGKAAKFGTDVGYNLTKIGLSTALNAITGIPAGSAMYFTDMGVDNFNQAKLDGYDDASAALFSVLGVTSEMLTEKFLGGFAKKLKLGKGESSLSTFYNGLLGKLLKNDKIRSVLSNALSEGTEEFVQEFIENFNKNLVLKKENLVDATKNTFNKDVLKDAMYSALVGIGSGGLMSLGNPVINTNNTGILPALTKEGNVNVDSYTSDLQNALLNPRYENRVDNINQTIDYLNLNKAMGNNEVASQTMNNNIQALAPVLSQYSDVLNASNDNVLPSRNNQVVLPRASDNINTNENINQTKNNTDRFQYAPTADPKVNTLYDSVSRYNFNDSEKTHNLVNTLAKVIKDKGYNIVFDNTNMNGINGKIETKNGEVTITLNPDSPRAFEFVAVHEITHAIETNSLKNMIMSYAKKNGEFNAALDSLKKTYGTNDINSEVIADISGQLLGNQEFINNLSMEQPGLFKRLYNNIKAFYHKLRGWKSQDEFVQDLMNKWEYAYATQQNNLKNEITHYHISENLSENIDYVLNNISERNPVRLRDYTPQILVENGIKDLPMYENPSHIRKNILNDNEARQLGLSINEKDHYHGLGKELFINAIDSLDNPRVIFKNTINPNEYLILTTIKDNNNNNVIVPIQIETTTKVNNILIDINRIKTVYGYDRVNPDLNQYIKDNINAKKLTKIYEQKKNQSTNITSQFDSFANNISQNDNNVNTQYSIQENTKELDNSSFSLEQRVSGDTLLDAQDLINEVKSVGAEVDNNGYVTLYHQTSNENAQYIRNTGKMKTSGEDYVYFSTSENAQQSQGRGDTKLEFKIPAEKLELDDLFSDNADVKIKLNGKKTLDVSDYLVENNTQESNNGSFSLKENNNLRDRAKSELGTTTNLNEAGYLTTDGEYLDFSGKKDGARGGTRTLDHRDIAEVYSDAEYDAAENKYSNMGSATAILQDFIDRGNIRLNNTGIEIATAPTQQQYNALYDYLEHIQKTNGEVFIDLDTETKNRTNLEYNEKTSISKMINDIKEHYNELNQDVKYSKNATEWNDYLNKTFSKDNEGRNLSKQQREYFKDSKVVDNNGNLITVYHTTTDAITQFNEFNPVGTEGYKFGNQVVNFYTNSKTMSSSYADYNYQKADTSKLNSIKEAKNWISKKTNKNNKYDFKEVHTKFGEIHYVITKNGETLLNYNSQQTMLRNLKSDFQSETFNNVTNLQYEGYVNITNPFVVDAEEANWNEIRTNYDDISLRYAREISDADKTALMDLAQESKEKYDSINSRERNIKEELADLQREGKFHTINGVEDTENYRQDVLRQVKGKTKEKVSNLIDEFENLYTKPNFEDDYFKQNVKPIQDKINNEFNVYFSEQDLYSMARTNFVESDYKGIFGNRESTNSIIQDVLNKNEKYGANYDGVIIKNVMDYGSTMEFDDTGAAQDVYVTFNSNQFKAADNTNPTTDSDIRYSKNNKTWQQYLEENYISRGTRTFGKDIRKQETQNKSADHKVIQKAIEESNTLKGDNVLKAKPKETTPVKQKQDNSRLTKAEQEELSDLEILYPVGMTTETQDVRLEYLQNKRDGLIKYPELKKKVEFKDISKEYTKFKNDIGKFDSKLLNEAKESVKGYRNTKTKQQWLDVAENIGLHFKGNSQQLTDYAVQSWFEAQPNNKNSLNREGKGYVKFSIDEWVNAVYKGAGVGDVMPRPKAQATTTKLDTNTTYTTSDIDNMFQFDDNDNRIIALPDAVGERLATKTNMTPIEVGNLQNILYSATNTVENGNQLEITSDYDNNIYTIKATKVGDAYVIDDITKGTKNALGSVANIETTTNDEVESIDNKKSKIENGQTIGEVINKIKTEIPKPADQRTQYKETVEKGTDLKESSFYKNATETSQFISEDNRTKLSEVGDIKYYESVTNEESLAKASKRLSDYGTAEAYRWMQQDNKTSSATDVAEGWILLKNYQDAGDYDSMVAVAKKMRQMGTVAGQTIQAYNIMARLTPEGMVKYAQNELSEALDVYSKNKSKAWLDKNASKFDLNAQEVGFIVDTMKQVESMEDGRAKNVKLAEINKMLTDKLPAERGSGIKAWMRISMLFNPKTQIRNILGNAVITPVNMVGDFFAAAADRIIAKKTNVRTTGKSDAKSYLKGFKKGLYESYDDFKRGINTRNIDANRFELGQAKSFNDNTKIGKALNRVDALNSFLLDIGDRGFYEASFTNSINNQLALNNTTKVTQDMIDIATSEALQRTWQDNNNYTKFVLTTRNMLNKVNVKGYGLGDLLIPFAKTPANLTKAIVDYSPAGMVNAILQARNLKNNISTGTNTAVQQHQFVQTLGKATAGTLLYVMAYGLAKAGIATGQSDDDKDTRDFIKNTLGISSYSIRIGDKSFTYDWAQPVAAPLSIMTNIVNSKNNKGVALLEAITSSLDSAGSILLEQSFLKSINDVLTDNDGIVSGLENAFLDLPARGIPTFMKQIVDMTDSTQRQTFEYNQPLKTAYNKIKAKIPGLSYTLEPSVDTLGREIQKYGGKNNIFNVFLNPANVNTSNISDAAKEIYKVYKEVGDKTIMPRVAPYYINSKGEKTILNTEQRKDFQTIAGNIIERSVNELTNNKNYTSMSDTEKSDVISKIVNYAYNKARKDVLGMDMSNEYNKINEWLDKGGTVASYYANKEEANFSLESPTKYSALQNMGINYYDYKEYQEKVNEIKKRYSGTNNASIRKQKVYEYVNSLKATANQKVLLFKMLGNYSIKDFSSQAYQYINSFNISAKEKKEIWNTLF